MRRLLVCVLLICLAACSQKAWNDRLASQEEQQLALQTAQQLREGDADDLAKITEPQLKAALPRAVAGVRAVLAQAQGPLAIETISVSQVNGGPVTKAFNLEAGSGSRWALVQILFEGAPGSWQLAGFHVWPSNIAPSKLNDFSISRRGLIGYIWLGLMFTCVAASVFAVTLIWRRPWLNRRWLWTLGSLFGFAGLGLNWSNGTFAILFINISVPPAQATKGGPFSPWLLSFAIPVVAIIVIVRWFRQARRETDTI